MKADPPIVPNGAESMTVAVVVLELLDDGDETIGAAITSCAGDEVPPYDAWPP